MERLRKLTLTDWTKANDALNVYFEGNKSKLTKHLDMSRTTVTNFLSKKPVREGEFRKICLALRLNWQEVSEVEAISIQETVEAANEEDWIGEVRSRCRQNMIFNYSEIRLLNQNRITVDQLYVDVWLLNRSPRTFQPGSGMARSFDFRNDRLGLGDRIRRDEGMTVANQNNRLLILGKPGAGKTTFLKHLAVDCSKERFQSELIPVLIELREIRSMEWKLLDAIVEQLKLSPQQTEKLLEQGQLLILMDGLDEIPSSAFRGNVQEQVCNLAQKSNYAKNRFILTCRTQIITGEMPQGFTAVEVADFNPAQVQRFVENWFLASGLTETEAEQKWQTFSEAIDQSPALKELTVTPVLLSLMCWVFEDTGELPTQAASLYDQGIDLLLERWNERKAIPEWEMGNEVYRALTLQKKKQLLTDIAAWKFEHPANFVLFEQKVLTQQIVQLLKLTNPRDGEAVLRSIEAQHGLLVERADRLWSFSHLTFQEHFTVQWLTQLSPEQLARKIANDQWQGRVRQVFQSQSSDKLIKLIKQAIDSSFSQNTELQEFLTWVQKKGERVNSSPKPAATRAFYFAFTLNIDLEIVRILDTAYARASDLNRGLDRALTNTLDCANTFNDAFEYALHNARPRDRTRALDHAAHLTFALGDSYIRACKFDFMLGNKLQQLKAQLPEGFSTRNWMNSKRWWIINGQAWTEELRQAMIEHRDIGHNWSFTEPQKQVLRQYYDANKFLVKLLGRKVSEEVRQEIEDKLLLPIDQL